MLGGFKGVFFLSISMLCAFSVSAQFVDDIPLFDGGEEKTELKKEPAKEVGSAAGAPSVPNKTEPNIGRRGIPLDELIVTPNPLPEVSIPLSDKVPVSETQPQPTVPVNTRQDGIYISPTGRTDENPAVQPSILTSVHDARQFDIEGFSLGMSPKSVVQAANQKGYKVTKIKKAIPLFQTSYYDTLCRQSGIYDPAAIRSCIRGNAQKNGQDYVEEIILTKKVTHESFQFMFTSPATGNEAYQVIYQNRGDNSLNFTRQNLAKKLSRKEAFFNAVFEMYGYPDDNEHMIWGNKEDAYMQVTMMGTAYDAVIKLVDMKLSDEDYFEASDWKADHETPYHFGFIE